MASLPTIEEAERAILDIFSQKGTRPGESIKLLVLTELMAGNPPPFRKPELDAALTSMEAKKWVEFRTSGFLALTELGFAQV